MIRLFTLALLVGYSGVSCSYAESPQEAQDDKLNAAERELVEIMERKDEAYRKYYGEAAKIEDPVARAKFFEENAPPTGFVNELLEFEREHRATLAGLMALRHLVLAALDAREAADPRYLGRRDALTILPKYAGFDELPSALSLIRLGPFEPETERALRRLMAREDISPANAQLSKYLLARWILYWSDARDFAKRRLQELRDGSDPRYAVEKEHLEERLDSLPDSRWFKEMEQKAHQILMGLSDLESPAPRFAMQPVDSAGYIVRVNKGELNETPAVNKRAQGLLFKQSHLRPGKPAPDLELELLSGEQWGMAAQDGKVVVIQFSFTGCGPCERMYPDLRKLQSDHQGQIAILTVMTDEQIEDTTRAVDSGKITWAVHWDGNQGPIATKWSVHSFPTIYVIGPDGTIAARDLRGEQLREKVAELVGQDAGPS